MEDKATHPERHERASGMEREIDEIAADVERLRDEVRLKAHLLGMDMRTAWTRLEPRVEELLVEIESTGFRATRRIERSLASVREGLREMRDELAKTARQ